METILNILSGNLVYSVGWTIFHSLWQGAIISALLGVLFIFLRKSSARIRYNISVIALISFLSIVILTFIKINSEVLIPGTQSGAFSISTGNEGIEAAISGEGTARYMFQPTLGIRSGITLFLNNNYIIITGLWMIGIFILGIKFLGGLLYTKRLKHSGLIKIPDEWSEKLQAIKSSLGITRPVQLFESMLAKVPVVIGYIKPVILLPAGAFTGIPPAQIETILAHELGHIRRADFLVNIIQSLLEIMLFYHPAKWWISSVIRTERENCCDHIAVEYSGEVLIYVKALLNIHERYGEEIPELAVACSGKNYTLINRIRRITKMSQKRINNGEKWISALIMIILLSGATLVTGSGTDNTVSYKVSNELLQTVTNDGTASYHSPPENIYPQDSVKLNGTIKTVYTDPADEIEKDVEIEFENGVVKKLVIDGKVIPESDYSIYQDLIDDTGEDMEEALVEIEEAEAEIELALEEIEEIDFEEVEMEIEEAIREIEEIDIEEIRLEIEETLREIREIDIIEIEAEIEDALKEVREIDIKDIELDIIEAIKEIEEIDLAEIETEIERALEEVRNIDHEKIKKEMEKSLKEIEESLKNLEIDLDIDIDKIRKDLENQLIEIQENMAVKTRPEKK